MKRRLAALGTVVLQKPEKEARQIDQAVKKMIATFDKKCRKCR